MANEMKIYQCKGCGHKVVSYHKILRHVKPLGNMQVYSDKCMERNCPCEHAVIVLDKSLNPTMEKAKVAKIVQEVFG